MVNRTAPDPVTRWFRENAIRQCLPFSGKNILSSPGNQRISLDTYEENPHLYEYPFAFKNHQGIASHWILTASNNEIHPLKESMNQFDRVGLYEIFSLQNFESTLSSHGLTSVDTKRLKIILQKEFPDYVVMNRETLYPEDIRIRLREVLNDIRDLLRDGTTQEGMESFAIQHWKDPVALALVSLYYGDLKQQLIAKKQRRPESIAHLTEEELRSSVEILGDLLSDRVHEAYAEILLEKSKDILQKEEEFLEGISGSRYPSLLEVSKYKKNIEDLVPELEKLADEISLSNSPMSESRKLYREHLTGKIQDTLKILKAYPWFIPDDYEEKNFSYIVHAEWFSKSWVYSSDRFYGDFAFAVSGYLLDEDEDIELPQEILTILSNWEVTNLHFAQLYTQRMIYLTNALFPEQTIAIEKLERIYREIQECLYKLYEITDPYSAKIKSELELLASHSDDLLYFSKQVQETFWDIDVKTGDWLERAQNFPETLFSSVFNLSHEDAMLAEEAISKIFPSQSDVLKTEIAQVFDYNCHYLRVLLKNKTSSDGLKQDLFSRVVYEMETLDRFSPGIKDFVRLLLSYFGGEKHVFPGKRKFLSSLSMLTLSEIDMILLGFKRMLSHFPKDLEFQSDEEAWRMDLIQIETWVQKTRKKFLQK